MKIRKVLIANRGEIALRVIRACRELGITTVSIHSSADEYSLHRRFSDEDVCIGPPKSADSYLSIMRILSAAEVTGADAIHPGYGFLSENSRFVDICNENKLIFIGPSSDAISKMGDKATARKIAQDLGVPVIPGSSLLSNFADAEKTAKNIGFPLIIKASGGGGGKGMRIVNSKKEFKKQFELVQNEALKAFGNSGVYIEKFLTKPRHIEIQVIADSYGNLMHLGERDCSIQRKYQKLIEEAPSLFVDDELRAKLGEMALKLTKAVNYTGVGTVEFLVDENKEFYFIEMNTRIQVEHPVTEMITGIDLVKAQLNIANGKALSDFLDKLDIKGHAIECRINAEDPENDFQPSAGKIKSYHSPGGFGVRVDSHIYAGYEIPPFYDSLLSKLIVWGKDRDHAIESMKRALGEYVIEGVDTTISFHKNILDNKYFISGDYSTNFKI